MNTLDAWTEAVCRDLGLDPATVDITALLDVARDVAHGVTRPAAPLTAYLLGVAVGRGLPAPEAAARITGLAAAWAGAHGQGARLYEHIDEADRSAS